MIARHGKSHNTDSDSLILDERFMHRLGVDPAAPLVKRVEGTDETSNPFVRYFTTLEGRVHPVGAPHLAQERPRVMFQRIIHDGLVGRAFLARFAVTYDLPRERVILRRTASDRIDGGPPDGR